MRTSPRKANPPPPVQGHLVNAPDPNLGLKIAAAFVSMVILFSLVGSFVVYHLWSGDGKSTTQSASLAMINAASDIDQNATTLLVACERYSVTLDPTDAEASKVALTNLRQAVTQAKGSPAYRDVTDFRTKVDQIEEKMKNFEGSFDGFTDSTSEMGEALNTMQDTQETFPKYVEKIVPTQLALYDAGPVPADQVPIIKRRMEIVYQTLSLSALANRLVTQGYAERKEAKIEEALRVLTDIDGSMQELLSITPETREHAANIQRKDDLSNAQAQAAVLHNYVKFFLISWKSMEKAKANCATNIRDLQYLAKDIATHSGQHAATEATTATLAVEKYNRLTLYCIAGIAIAALVGTILVTLMITSGLNNTRRVKVV